MDFLGVLDYLNLCDLNDCFDSLINIDKYYLLRLNKLFDELFVIIFSIDKIIGDNAFF